MVREPQELLALDIKMIDRNPKQPRKAIDIEKLEELSDSIKATGLIQPIVVRKKRDRYEIIVGERRWKACKMAGLQTIPAIVKEASDQVVPIQSLVENIQRQDLGSTERESAIHELWSSGQYMSHAQLAKVLGYRSASTVTDIIDAKEMRDRHFLPDKLSTKVIRTTRGLPEKERLLILKKVERGELGEWELENNIGDMKKIPQEMREDIISQRNLGRAREIRKVYENAPKELQEVMKKGDVSFDDAKGAVQMYEDLAQKGIKIEQKRMDSHLEQLKKEKRERDLESGIREEAHRAVLIGESGVRKHWAEGLTDEPLAVQTANWIRWNLERIGKKVDFYTTHYSQKDLETFVQILIAAGVKILIDVRNDPASQFKPEFNKSHLSKYLEKNGIRYVHRQDLGVPRNIRDQLVSSGDWKWFFDWYDENLSMNENEIIGQQSPNEIYAFMCVEKNPRRCHRHRIAVRLESRGLKSLDI